MHTAKQAVLFLPYVFDFGDEDMIQLSLRLRSGEGLSVEVKFIKLMPPVKVFRLCLSPDLQACIAADKGS